MIGRARRNRQRVQCSFCRIDLLTGIASHGLPIALNAVRVMKDCYSD